MKVELLVDDRRGHIYNINPEVITWKTQRKGRASSIEFEIPKGDAFSAQGFKFSNGQILRLSLNGTVIFYGMIVKNRDRNSRTYSVLAYNQIFHLMYKDTIVFTNMTASNLTTLLGKSFGLTLGNIEDTKYSIPKIIREDEKILDMLEWSIGMTTLNTGELYVIYDNSGSLNLVNYKKLFVNNLNYVVAEDFNLMDFEYEKSIESEVYTRFKITSVDSKTKERKVFVKNTDNQQNLSDWGILQYYERVEGLNDAQIQQKLETMKKLKSSEIKQLTVEVIGDKRVFAGTSVYVVIPSLGISQYYLVESATHKILDDDYTMTLELRAV